MDKDDEVQDFRARLKTLQHVAIEIRGALDEQNKRLESNDTLLHRSLKHIDMSLRRINGLARNRFNVNLYMVLAALVFAALFYIFFVMT